MTGPITTETLVEDGCRAVYGKNWDGPADKAPGEAMRKVWRDLVAKAQAPLLAALQRVTAERDEARARADGDLAAGNEELRALGTFDRKMKVGKHQATNLVHLRSVIAALDAAGHPDAADTLIWQVWHRVNSVARAHEFLRLANADQEAAEASLATATSELARLRADVEAVLDEVEPQIPERGRLLSPTSLAERVRDIAHEAVDGRKGEASLIRAVNALRVEGEAKDRALKEKAADLDAIEAWLEEMRVHSSAATGGPWQHYIEVFRPQFGNFRVTEIQVARSGREIVKWAGFDGLSTGIERKKNANAALMVAAVNGVRRAIAAMDRRRSIALARAATAREG